MRAAASPLSFTHCLLMLSKRGMNYTAVEQDLGCVGNLVEDSQCLVELVVVVAGEGCHPGLDFLLR